MDCAPWMAQTPQESLELGAQTVAMASAAACIAAETQVELVRQRETLHRVDRAMDTLADANQAACGVVGRLGSFWQRWFPSDWVGRAPSPAPPPPGMSVGSRIRAFPAVSGAGTAPVGTGAVLDAEDFLQRSDQQCDAAAVHLARLMSTAVAIRDEIEGQEALLRCVDQKTIASHETMSKTLHQINRLG